MLAYLFSLFLLSSHADFTLAPNLNQTQRILILKTLGLGTLSKNLSPPRPLGSNSGVEIGIMTEIINTSEIKNLINNSQAENTLYYPKIIIGKGLYDRGDIYFHFIPYTAKLGLSEFGGMLRFNLYKSDTNPFVASWLLHANSANFNNQLIVRNIGSDISLGLDWGSFSLFAAGGWGKSSGKFIGGTQGVTDSLLEEKEEVDSPHYAIGALVKYSIWNMSLSFDHYEEPIYTVKVGVIF